jgi:hypothetical protein
MTVLPTLVVDISCVPLERASLLGLKPVFSRDKRILDFRVDFTRRVVKTRDQSYIDAVRKEDRVRV